LDKVGVLPPGALPPIRKPTGTLPPLPMPGGAVGSSTSGLPPLGSQAPLPRTGKLLR